MKKVTATTFALLLLVAHLLLAGGASDPPPAPGDQARPTLRGTGGVNATATLEKPYVILVSFDGFRHDYLELYDTPSFDRVREAGVTADALLPVFPTLTFPNHYSIATGMYPENHGIVGNRFYDPDRDEVYSYQEPEKAQDGSWYGGEPIWVTAETQGMVAASYFFVGSEADVKDVRPTFWLPYNEEVPYTERVDQVLNWLRLPAERRPHVVSLYFSAVDEAGHRFGPATPQVGEAVQLVGRMLGRLLDGIDALVYSDRVYVALVSDHGMAEVLPNGYYAIDRLVNLAGVKMGGTDAYRHLFVEEEAARVRQLRDELRGAMPHANVYLREEVPERLHHRANPRIGDLVVVADEGYRIRSGNGSPDELKGAHGWDPTLPSMGGIFLVMGPGISPRQRLPAFESIHVYPFLAHLLELRPNPEIDGDLSVLGHLLQRPPNQ